MRIHIATSPRTAPYHTSAVAPAKSREIIKIHSIKQQQLRRRHLATRAPPPPPPPPRSDNDLLGVFLHCVYTRSCRPQRRSNINACTHDITRVEAIIHCTYITYWHGRNIATIALRVQQIVCPAISFGNGLYTLSITFSRRAIL